MFRVVALFFALLTPATAAFAGLTWGICGHPLTHQAVWNDPEKQLATLQRYGLTTYRFDVFLTDDRADAVDQVQKLADLARKYGITLHPVLFVPFTFGDNATDNGKYPDTEEGLEAQGYHRVLPFVQKFASQITDWELENELNLVPGVKVEGGFGFDAADFETPKAGRWAAVLRGMSKAVHEAQGAGGPPLRSVVDTTYVNFGFIRFLEAHGVVIDKIAYHYYYAAETNPYQISAPGGTRVDLFALLKQLGKPVILNEFNAAEIYAPQNEGKPYDDAKALVSLRNHIDFIRKQTEADIEGVEYYELYNEPAKSGVESNFGLMTDADHPRTQMLLAASVAGAKLSPEEQTALAASGLFAP